MNFFVKYSLLAKLYKDIASETGDFPELFYNYMLNFCFVIFVLIFILSFIYRNKEIYKKILILSTFTAGSTFFFAFVFPFVIFDQKCFHCGRIHGFFNSYQPYMALLLILVGAYLSKYLNDDYPGFFSIEVNSIYLILNYILSFLFALLIYIPIMLILLLLNIPFSKFDFFSNQDLNSCFVMVILCVPFGAYTGLIIDKLIINKKISYIFKYISCFLMCFISSLNVLLYGVYHVNEGVK